MTASMPGDWLPRWAWAVPAAGGVVSAVAFAQVRRRRPLLSTPGLRTEWFYQGMTKRYQLLLTLLFLTVGFALFSALGVVQSVGARSPEARAVARAFAAVAFGTEAIVLGGG